MESVAFLSSFAGVPLRSNRSHAITPARSPRRKSTHHSARRRAQMTHSAPQAQQPSSKRIQHESTKPRRAIGIVSKSTTKSTTKTVESPSSGGLFGMKANAYWESIGVLPLAFAGFGMFALAIKLFKVKSGELRGVLASNNKVSVPKTAITTEAEEAELHAFKCAGCGYEMYPARGREFKFFPDSFKCPLCGTPKSEFWDLNDPNDPRNQEPNDEEDEGDDQTPGEDSPSSDPSFVVKPEEQSKGNENAGEAGSTARDRAESDTSM